MPPCKPTRRVRECGAPQRRRKQSGLVLVLVVVILLAIAGTALLIAFANRLDRDVKRVDQSTDNNAPVHRAIATFVATHSRLPCPASPTSFTGVEDVDLAQAEPCLSPAGVLPWGSLGLPIENGLDSWGRKFSYRVFSGATGFTRTRGLTAVDCNTSALLMTSARPLDITNSCSTSPPGTKIADYLAGKGIIVNDKSVLKNQIAYVLISHGSTGRGAFGADNSGTRQTTPDAMGREFTNTTVPIDNTYWILTPNTTVDQSAAAFFDDVVSYRSADELLRAANAYARDWGWIEASLTGTSNVLMLVVKNHALQDAKVTRAVSLTLPVGYTVSTPTGSCVLGTSPPTPASLASTGNVLQIPLNYVFPKGDVDSMSGARRVQTCTFTATVTGTSGATPGIPLLAGTDTDCGPSGTTPNMLCTDRGWPTAQSSATLTLP
jgi:hypothetical protein